MVAHGHGNMDEFFEAVDKGLDIQKHIINPFNGDHCKGLKGKPKMFFVQTSHDCKFNL